MRLAMSVHSLLVLTRTGLAMSLHSILVLIKGVWEQGKPRECTPYWRSPGEPGNKASMYTCSPGEPGNKASHELALHTADHQGSLGTRLAQRLYSAQVLTRGAWKKG